MPVKLFKRPTATEDEIRARYRLPKNTKVYRNLAIRFWYRSGMKPLQIMKQELAEDVTRPQTIYQIIKSPVYKYIEEDFGLIEKEKPGV